MMKPDRTDWIALAWLALWGVATCALFTWLFGYALEVR